MMSTATPTMKILLSVLEDDTQGEHNSSSPASTASVSAADSSDKDPLAQSGLRRIANGKLAAANRRRYNTLRLKLEEMGVETEEGSAESCYTEAERLFRRSQSVRKLDLSDKS